MYRLMIYFLITTLIVAAVLSALGLLPYNWVDIVFAGFYLPGLAWLADKLFASLWQAASTGESAIITGLIIALITGPQTPVLVILKLSGIVLVAIASKYLLAISARHIFNPAAAGVLVGAWLWHQGASWWVGTPYLLPLVIMGGLLVQRQARRWPIIVAFLLVGIIAWPVTVWTHLLSLPVLFFALVMLIEPQTSPGVRRTQYIFGAGVALIWGIQLRWLSGYPYSLETALLAGNFIYWLLVRDRQILLTLTHQTKLNERARTFHFSYTERFNFTAGQYLQWTLPHRHADSRGIRRWFTISAAPTEKELALTTVLADPSSTFKQALRQLEPGNTITAAGLSGEFVLPADTQQKLVFIAGGVGITPFRSMIKYLLDTKQQRPIILIYSNRTVDDILFTDLWTRATKQGWLTVHQVLTQEAPANWTGERGYIDAKMIKKLVPNWPEYLFYLSGPEPMVKAFSKFLKVMGLKSNQLKRDFFPGYTETHQRP